MNASLSECPSTSLETTRRIQINTSPNSGEVDLSPLAGHGLEFSSLDMVSLADILRNAFVYPPHTIYSDVKIAATGFDPAQDMHDNPRFHFPFQSELAPARPLPGQVDDDTLLRTYHRLLCDAIARSTAGVRSPWLLQSGGKDSTSLAIAAAEAAPQTTCITYLGGFEENEIESARSVARKLGLRHEALVCDPGRAYDRYLAIAGRMPSLTADFALLSYVDLLTTIADAGGDGVVDRDGAQRGVQLLAVRRHAGHQRRLHARKDGVDLAREPGRIAAPLDHEIADDPVRAASARAERARRAQIVHEVRFVAGVLQDFGDEARDAEIIFDDQNQLRRH